MTDPGIALKAEADVDYLASLPPEALAQFARIGRLVMDTNIEEKKSAMKVMTTFTSWAAIYAEDQFIHGTEMVSALARAIVCAERHVQGITTPLNLHDGQEA